MASKKITCILSTALVLMSASTIYAAQVLFTPTLTLTEEYTDNLFLTPDNEVDDFITTAGIGLNGQVLWRTAGLELNYNPSYNKFADNSELDYWRHLASLYTWKEIKRNTRLELRNTYLRTNDPVDETDAIDPDDPLRGSAIEADVDRRGRNEYYTNTAELRLTHQFGTSDSFYLAYQYRLLREVDTVEGLPVDDNDISTTSGGVAYNFSPKWTTELDAYYRDSEYEDENDRVEYNGNVRILYNFDRYLSGFVAYRHTVLEYDQDIDEDYQIYHPTIGVEKRFQGNARISVGAGYYVQDFDTSEDESGFNVDSEIYKRWEFRTSYIDILATSGYEIDDAGVEDTGLRIYYQGRVELGYNFSPRLSSNIFSAYRYDEYPNAVTDRVDNTLRAGAELDWQILQWMTAGLAYNFRNVTSDIEAYEYTENNVMLTITMTPTSPYRLN